MALIDIKGREITKPVFIPTAEGEIDLQSAGGSVDLSTLATKEEVETLSGDLSTLVTTDKTDIVSAINETFTNANNGKQLVRSSIVGKGGSVPADPTFSQLAGAIDLTYMYTKDPDLIGSNVKKDIVIGDVTGTLEAPKYHEGYVDITNDGIQTIQWRTVTGLPFRPKFVEIQMVKDWTSTNSIVLFDGALSLFSENDAYQVVGGYDLRSNWKVDGSNGNIRQYNNRILYTDQSGTVIGDTSFKFPYLTPMNTVYSGSSRYYYRCWG